MPYEVEVMNHLYCMDPLTTIWKACNNVYHDPLSPKLLREANTHWLEIKCCLLEKFDGDSQHPVGPNLIVGAGGASRAALCALNSQLHCPIAYVLNRDEGEVTRLIHDSQNLSPLPNIVHVRSIKQAKKLASPYSIVCYALDIEAQTEAEKVVTVLLAKLLSRKSKSILLDIWFKRAGRESSSWLRD
jgi:quinate dehydrogenase